MDSEMVKEIQWLAERFGKHGAKVEIESRLLRLKDKINTLPKGLELSEACLRYRTLSDARATLLP